MKMRGKGHPLIGWMIDLEGGWLYGYVIYYWLNYFYLIYDWLDEG